jgi:uncharacterized protein (DUF924 family)
MSLPPDAEAVLAYWFGTPAQRAAGVSHAFWFRKSDATDADIRQRFSPLIERALKGELSAWASASDSTPESALAQVIVLDQFPRNVFRNTPRSFAGDPLALSAARAMVSSGQDLALTPVQRSFVYLPWEHSENLADQDEAIRLFTQLAATAPQTADSLDYARRHREIIVRFGRFPHRNAILGRASTPEEAAFLKQPGSGF